MLLHTIQPLSLVFYRPEGQSYTYRQMHNGYLQGIQNRDGSFTLSRLISTDPGLYLDPRYFPGAVVPPGKLPPARRRP